MSNGTTIPVYVPRLHKSNAESEKQDSEDYIRWLERSIIAMAANGGLNFAPEGGEPWYEHVAREIPSLLEEYREACFKNTMAYHLLDSPESCHDELEAGDAKEPK